MIKIVSNVDYDGNNQINYTEFIAATLDVSKVLEKNDKFIEGILDTKSA